MIFNKHAAVIASIAIPMGFGCSSPDNGDTSESRATQNSSQTGAAADDASQADDASDDGATADDATVADDGAGAGSSGVVAPDGVGDFNEPVIAESESDLAALEEQRNEECAAANVGTSLVNVVLAFTYDVSASMGSEFTAYYSRELKWQPVVDATKAFFTDPSSAGISATLTFFPDDSADLVGTLQGGAAGGGGMAGGAMGGGGFAGGAMAGGMDFGEVGVAGVGGGQWGNAEMCQGASYETPDVPLTALPSDAFSAAIDAVTPVENSDWRLGTPTGPALEGSIEAIRAMQEADPNAKYVIVLVTDGEPSFCPNNGGDDINLVADVVAAVADEIPTYVIGLGNPVTDAEPNPPDDGLDNLHVVAAAGGTDQAHIIDTNDPASTAANFRAVIDEIRENSFSCALEIPAPPDGQRFDPTKVNVQYNNTMGTTEFVNDPTCAADFAWYYDDPDSPSVIHMCENVCTDIKADYQNQGELAVEFGCVSRVAIAN